MIPPKKQSGAPANTATPTATSRVMQAGPPNGTNTAPDGTLNQLMAGELNALSTQVSDYLLANLSSTSLTATDKAALDGLQSKLYHWATALVAVDIASTGADLQGAQACLQAATKELTTVANDLTSVTKIINIASGVIQLAQAVVTHNVNSIGTSIQSIYQAIAAKPQAAGAAATAGTGTTGGATPAATTSGNQSRH